jgi:hypothetical protein
LEEELSKAQKEAVKANTNKQSLENMQLQLKIELTKQKAMTQLKEDEVSALKLQIEKLMNLESLQQKENQQVSRMELLDQEMKNFFSHQNEKL